jgi:hypothetical protein
MDRLHVPLVETCRKELASDEGNIIDLGCGNGALLLKVCAGKSSSLPFGIDRNAKAIEHAKLLHAQTAANFETGDFLSNGEWASRRYKLAILMIGRLIEASPAQRSIAIARLRVCCERILFYAYPGYASESVESMAVRVGFQNTEATGEDGARLLRVSNGS